MTIKELLEDISDHIKSGAISEDSQIVLDTHQGKYPAIRFDDGLKVNDVDYYQLIVKDIVLIQIPFGRSKSSVIIQRI